MWGALDFIFHRHSLRNKSARLPTSPTPDTCEWSLDEIIAGVWCLTEENTQHQRHIVAVFDALGEQ